MFILLLSKVRRAGSRYADLLVSFNYTIDHQGMLSQRPLATKTNTA